MFKIMKFGAYNLMNLRVRITLDIKHIEAYRSLARMSYELGKI